MTRILAIETSCDDTGVSIIDINTDATGITSGTILAHKVSSQVAEHRKWGGVVPNLAKEEHQRRLVPLLKDALTEAELGIQNKESNRHDSQFTIHNSFLDREPILAEEVTRFLPTIETPAIDAIAVTYAPGLEPALWVGINFAKALSLAWQKPLIPTHHMEGHIYSSLLKNIRIDLGGTKEFEITKIQFPAIVLLASGGHTELLAMRSIGSYEHVGKTRDDAVGEAFDKVARTLGLPYPGGPEISRCADLFRRADKKPTITLPSPMLHSDDFDFSFSGIKTAVAYLVRDLEKLTDEMRNEIAYVFEEAVTKVIVSKTARALEHYNTNTLITGGGVMANTTIRGRLEEISNIQIHLPEKWLTGDNATMIALASYFNPDRALEPKIELLNTIKATGTLALCAR